MPEVEVFAWNPRRTRLSGPLGRLRRRIPMGPRIGNFGDLLGPLVVQELCVRRGLDPRRAVRPARLLSIGSVIRCATDGDVVWGSGVNGKSLDAVYDFEDLDVRAVRGPKTADFLRQRGIAVPDVFGDPGLLVGHLWDRATVRTEARHEVTVIPNLNDFDGYAADASVVDPRAPLWDVISRIAASEFVTGSSLHAVVLADSFGVPSRLVRSSVEPEFKYEDYYLGSGRSGYSPAATVRAAIEMGPEPLPSWSPENLLAAFPDDLWHGSATVSPDNGSSRRS